MLRWWTFSNSIWTYCARFKGVGFGLGVGFSMLYFTCYFCLMQYQLSGVVARDFFINRCIELNILILILCHVLLHWCNLGNIVFLTCLPVEVLALNSRIRQLALQTGRDGCICRFSVLTEDVGHQGRSNDQGLMCTGVEDVPAITVVESVQCFHAPNQKIMRRLAAGFTASDFVLWDLTNQSEVS